MANSGIQWIDYTFNLRWLYACADVLGITYEEINVWLFCIAWPCRRHAYLDPLAKT